MRRCGQIAKRKLPPKEIAALVARKKRKPVQKKQTRWNPALQPNVAYENLTDAERVVVAVAVRKPRPQVPVVEATPVMAVATENTAPPATPPQQTAPYSRLSL